MSMMYQAYQNHMDLTEPWRTGAASALRYLNLVPQGVSDKVFGAARRCARADLALLADLCAPGLRHRQRDGGQPRTRGDRGGRLRDAVRLAAALREGGRARAAAAAAGGADVRPFRHPAPRHREDAAAGSRRLHHRLAQSARHPGQPRAGSASTTTPSTSSTSSASSARGLIWSRSASRRCPRSRRLRSCARTTIPRGPPR